MSAIRPPFKWNAHLERRLRHAISEGMSQAECARLLHTNRKTIAIKAAELGLEFRRWDLSSAGAHAGIFDTLEDEL
jgi:hypothetical protein